MLINPSLWGSLRDRANFGVWDLVGSGVPDATFGASFAGLGSSYTDIATGIRYTNLGTAVTPSWINLAGAVIGLGGLGAIQNAKMTYDFAVDGGAVGLITPANSPTIPAKAIILGGVIDITTTLTSGASATIALGTSAGSAANSLKTATAVATWAAGVTVPVIPVFTAATYLKLTAAGRLTLTVAVADLTAGVFDVNLLYVMGN